MSELVDRLTAAFMGHADSVDRNLFGRARDEIVRLRAENDRLRDEVERLQDRLEMRHAWQVVDGKEVRITVEPGSIPDGIDARDETIRQLDKNCDTLRSERDRLRDALALYREAVVIDVKMEGPRFMGANSSALKRAWDYDRAALGDKP